MNRKNFLRNLLGTTVAVTVGKYIAPLAIIPEADVPGIGGQTFKASLDSTMWMDHQMYLLTQRMYEDQERALWYGTVKTTPKYEETVQ